MPGYERKQRTYNSLNHGVHKNIPVTWQKEELLNDPAARLVLYRTGKQRKEHVKKTAAATGLQVYRVRKRARSLEQHGFLRLEKGKILNMRDAHIEALKRYHEDLQGFAYNRHTDLRKMIQEASDRLEQEKERLKEQKASTDSVKKEKKLEKKIRFIEEVVERQETRSPVDALKTYSRHHRALSSFEEVEIHGSNFVRKARTVSVLEGLFNDSL